ncbi:hypothetical protein [Bradyrhizobium sp. AUGA SZCCT0160]|uniref:hypothetical protein n=1 Tax=Bradyrhizobium sp. AUGA SZCCT0160 TaxID=2807662 RepID=UPI001BAB8883|nr:hypothetical protein [Bradyrhizobium sp. AUGA SZCCT0160]MBR1190362.1 hypothetical protein [Bradyrhizobium sp. AUGA SZCCT0160]
MRPSPFIERRVRLTPFVQTISTSLVYRFVLRPERGADLPIEQLKSPGIVRGFLLGGKPAQKSVEEKLSFGAQGFWNWNFCAKI